MPVTCWRMARTMPSSSGRRSVIADERYLRDCIELFEENGWDWAYHAFREWNGWSVEHGPDKQDNSRSKSPTDREQLLRDVWNYDNIIDTRTVDTHMRRLREKLGAASPFRVKSLHSPVCWMLSAHLKSNATRLVPLPTHDT